MWIFFFPFVNEDIYTAVLQNNLPIATLCDAVYTDNWKIAGSPVAKSKDHHWQLFYHVRDKVGAIIAPEKRLHFYRTSCVTCVVLAHHTLASD